MLEHGMNPVALRARILLLLGLPATAGAGLVVSSCKGAPPVPPDAGQVNTSLVAPPDANVVATAQPIPSVTASVVHGDGGFGEAGVRDSGNDAAVQWTSKVCALDEVLEQVCGTTASPRVRAAPPFERCAKTGDELEAFGYSVVMGRPWGNSRDPAFASFELDRALSVAQQGACCYSVCTRLDVEAHPVAPAVPPNFRSATQCVPSPQRGTSVPAEQGSKCPAGLRLKLEAGVLEAPFASEQRASAQCCYRTSEPMPECPPGAQIGPNGQCGSHARGRPIREAGAVVLAPFRTRHDWAMAGIALEDLDPTLRKTAALAWGADAAAEHASVAAFAKLSLQLMALGAPADLVDACHVAAREEVVHARHAYALASALGGELVGPGPLPLTFSNTGHDLVSLMAETVLDGCVGETAAALDASEALRYTHAQTISSVLETIARDEAAHAELAFRVVAWTVREGGAPVRSVLLQLVDDLEHGASSPAPTSTERPGRGLDLCAFGLLDDEGAARVRTTAIRAVVVPCLRALLAAP